MTMEKKQIFVRELWRYPHPRREMYSSEAACLVNVYWTNLILCRNNGETGMQPRKVKGNK
jgi:hypothetical protein